MEKDGRKRKRLRSRLQCFSQTWRSNRFHLWEPIWYYEPRTKQPENSLKKARWLGIAHSAGDAMTYFIETERDGMSKRNVILVRSIIRTHRKNIGTEEEFVNDDPVLANFFLSRPEMEANKDDSMVDEVLQ
jgi:hypothetical protein